MKNRFILISLFTGLLCSCINTNRILYIEFDSIDGLTEKANVNLSGYKVAQVNEIMLTQDKKLLVKLKFEEDFHFPTDSKFIIENIDLLGNKAISIVPGKSKQLIAAGDTIIGFQQEKNFAIDSLVDRAKDFVGKLTGKEKQDSILIELRRLNSNLEALKERK